MRPPATGRALVAWFEECLLYPRSFGNYVLLERLGQGGMSEIDLARRAVEEANYVRFLVIKRIKADRNEDEAFLRMFKDEARISAELHHGNIAQVYDFGREGEDYYLVLEYIPGLDLRFVVSSLRDRGDGVPLRIALRVLHDVLAGLQYAHTRLDTFGRPMRIIHRDVNPRNIMLSIRGEVKLIDFGVAKATGRLERTRTDHVKGKFAYMAPEQVNGDEIDHRVDTFAAALMFHEMIAGYGAFYGLSQVQIVQRLTSGMVPDLPEHKQIPANSLLRSIQRRALAVNPSDRFPDAESYRHDIERFAAANGGLATPPELAKFLLALAPGLDAKIEQKMKDYAGPVKLGASEAPTVMLDATPMEMSGSLSRVRGGATATVTRTAMVGGGLAIAFGALAGLAVLATVGAVAAAIVQHQGSLVPPGAAKPPPMSAPVDTDH